MKNSIKRVSSKDVAKHLGVSQSTVSRVFSDKADLISQATRDRVKQAAKELGYNPSSIARSLSLKTTKIIGIEINDFNNAYYMEALGFFTRAFKKKGYQLMIIPGDDQSGEDMKDMESRLKTALEYQVSGLILTNAVLDDEYLNWCDKYQTPIFMFNRISGENHKFNSVVGDNYQGGYEIGQLMVLNKYRKVAYIAGDANAYTNQKREEGFMDSIKQGSLDCIKINGSFTYKAGYEAALEILNLVDKVEAVFCASDSIALGFIDGIKHESSWKIPEDIAVGGFDGIREGSNINYLLTTYQQPLEDIVNKTVEELIHMIETGEGEGIQVTLPGKIVIRESLNKPD